MEKNLLRQEEGDEGEPRLSMMEATREYALERLEEAREAEAIHRRHADYFVALAGRAEPRFTTSEQGSWLARTRQLPLGSESVA